MDALIQIINMHGGSKAALARHLLELYPSLKVTSTHIGNWLNRDKKVPAEWIIPLCETVDFKIIPYDFKSPVYRHPKDGLPEHLRQAA
jgi:hypothetical protein